MSEELRNEITEEIQIRKNPFCVISKEAFGDYEVHDIQTNSAWTKNPYEDYVLIPDERVEEVLETRGFCELVLDDAGEFLDIVKLDIPEIPDADYEPTQLDRIEAQVTYTAMMTDTLMEV